MAVKKPKSKYSTAMLIDDSEIDNFINLKMLEGCNFADHIYAHTNGKSALEFLKNIERMGNKDNFLFPEVIFLDLNMPVMDGYQFIDEFGKMQDSLKNRTKIVILTTSLNPSDLERSKKYPQIIKFVNKPLTSQTLDSL
jgi:CheY-like chemotaxis protein